MFNPGAKSLSASIVATTIGEGQFLDDYVAHFVKAEILGQTRFVVIPDKKTPQELYLRCRRLRAQGVDIECPTLEEQEKYLAKLGIADLIPYDSDNRRNIGFLMAWERGSDFMISIDDDNFPIDGHPFFQSHSRVCSPKTLEPTVESSTGWLNICELLTKNPERTIYPRGFPYRHRFEGGEIHQEQVEAAVRVNAGLWLGDPDVDSITRLTEDVKTVIMSRESVILGKNTWTPINTQNTAIHRDVIPTYYFIPMGYPISGLRIDRYGDILSGYFCQACVKHMGDAVRVGSPLAEHRRNRHVLMRDLTQELGAILLVDDICDWLREVKLEGSTYSETYISLSYAIQDAAESFQGSIWTDDVRGYLHRVAHSMRRWIKAVNTLYSGGQDGS